MFFVATSRSLFSQEISRDSTLEEIIIQAYTADRPSEEVPVSLGYLNEDDLNRFSNTSMLPAANTIPGVRMEERSPGSYRFSIRGSTIRSPFGVRNVKVYWNGIPFTDAGGNTYLNLVHADHLGSIEVIKGPGGSLYGAGTGGVILLKTPPARENSLRGSAMIGTFGLQQYSIGGNFRKEQVSGGANLSLQSSEGYRDQSSMNRKAFNLDFKVPLSDKSSLAPVLLIADLFYETPGGLNKAQFEADPSQARPPVSTPTSYFPGAIEQKASVHNRAVFFGVAHELEWNERWNTTSSIYGASIDFENPAIRNYEQREEQNFGGRSVTKFTSGKGLFKNISSFGAEFQLLDASIVVAQNDRGKKGSLISQDNLVSKLFSVFAQHDILYNENSNVTLGLSANFAGVSFRRSLPEIVDARRDFRPVISPRIAALRKISDGISIYGSYSHGFSPPTIAELYPSRQVFDTGLEPERGRNFETGVKGKAFRQKLRYEFAVYHFSLTETIVLRRDASLPGEPEYFVNAGKTGQQGVEGMLSWNILEDRDGPVNDLSLKASYSYNHYRFRDYEQGGSDLSGKKFTGVPPTVAFAGVDVKAFRRAYLTISSNYVDHVPLNDENTAFAKPYVLVAVKAGYIARISGGKQVEIFGGTENLTNEIYSLGPDLNAVGNRYYNAAAPRNFYAGLKMDLSLKK